MLHLASDSMSSSMTNSLHFVSSSIFRCNQYYLLLFLSGVAPLMILLTLRLTLEHLSL